MTISKQITIDAPADEVWRVVAHDFHKADQWASSINRSTSVEAGPPPKSSPLDAAGRACDTSIGGIKEQIVHYDEAHKRFGYQAKGEKMPFFVKNLVNNWQVTEQNSGSAKVDMKLNVELMPVIGTVMGPMMKLQMGKLLGEAVEELKFFIENGKPHPRKVKAMQKAIA
ncbi:MAG: SRPBCC family protein [Rhodothermaceae bacterium]|nr:SRPBCC family protein [Rhodothermaceae bacterium]